MLEVLLSNRFKKDLKLAKKRGYNLELLYDVVDILARQEPLPEKTATTHFPATTPVSVNATSNRTGCWCTAYRTEGSCSS